MQIGDEHADKKLTLATHGPQGTGQLLSALIMAAMLGISLPIIKRATIWLEDTQLPLLAVIDRFNLYAYKVDSKEERADVFYARIRIADCLLRRTQATGLCPELLIRSAPEHQKIHQGAGLLRPLGGEHLRCDDLHRCCGWHNSVDELDHRCRRHRSHQRWRSHHHRRTKLRRGRHLGCCHNVDQLKQWRHHIG